MTTKQKNSNNIKLNEGSIVINDAFSTANECYRTEGSRWMFTGKYK